MSNELDGLKSGGSRLHIGTLIASVTAGCDLPDRGRSADPAGSISAVLRREIRPASVAVILLEACGAHETVLKEIRHDTLLWLLVFVPVVRRRQVKPDAHTLLFVLSVLAIVPWRCC